MRSVDSNRARGNKTGNIIIDVTFSAAPKLYFTLFGVSCRTQLTSKLCAGVSGKGFVARPVYRGVDNKLVQIFGM